jgi:peptidoglycan hydrolase CwlO-like protein
VRKANDLVTYYEENKIFFEREIAKEIDSLLSKFKDIWGQFQIGQEQKKSNSHKESLDSWNSAWKQIEKDVPKIKEKLENRFRDIIGIE